MPDLTLNLEKSLKEFHNKYGHLVSRYPTADIPASVLNLRIDLIAEEADELFAGLEKRSLVDIADGAADLIYVIVGTCVSFGIPIERVFREVHNSNMTKTPVKAENGNKYGTKTPKGPDYIPPDIKGIINRPHEETLLETNQRLASRGE